MCNLCQEYMNLCMRNNCEPNSSVLTELERCTMSGDKIIDLSSHCLSRSDCQVLGQIISSISDLQQMRLNDCHLPAKGIQAILEGLCGCRQLLCLELKANNIQGATLRTLSKLFQNVPSLCRLTLEWNNVGIISEYFGIFCASLARTPSLEYLDLRSNQINQIGAAEISRALKNNSSLKVLDLRWNNIGANGARDLWEALRCNQTIQQVEIAGNGVPRDLETAIYSTMNSQTKCKTLTDVCTSRSQGIARQMNDQQERHRQQMENLLQKLMEQECQLQASSRRSGEEMCQMQGALQECSAQRECARKSLELTRKRSCELEAAVGRSQEVAERLQAEKGDLEQRFGKLQQEMFRDEQDKARLQGELQSEKEQSQELRKRLMDQAREVDQVRSQCQQRLYQLQQEAEARERELRHSRDEEVSRVQQSLDELRAFLEGRLAEVEQQRNLLEKKVEEVNCLLQQERVQVQEMKEELHAARESAQMMKATIKELEVALCSAQEERASLLERLRVGEEEARCLRAEATTLKEELRVTMRALQLEEEKVADAEARVQRAREEVEAQAECLRNEVRWAKEEAESQRQRANMLVEEFCRRTTTLKAALSEFLSEDWCKRSTC